VPGADSALVRLLTDPAQPALVRASSAARLRPPDQQEVRQALRKSLGDSSPLVRRAAIGTLEWLPAGERGEWLAPLLSDPVRSVRSEAARLLADVPLAPSQVKSFELALGEYEAQLRLHADRAEARSELAHLRRRQGREEEAAEQLEAAIRLDALYQPAYLESADMHHSAGREGQAEAVLRQGLAARPQAALLHYSLALSLVRQQRMGEAIDHLKQAQELSPGDPRFAYALALALHPRSPERALAVLQHALRELPHEQDLLWLAGIYSLQLGHSSAAIGYAERLLEADPSSSKARELLQRARSRAKGR
jgi:tetratricopeptide (TPR) repeat protein